ncbi:putative epoxide hydrolase, partial [Phialemonium atrogriseum]
MAPDKLRVNDPRVESRTAQLNGRTYHYLLGNPAGATPPAATVVLLHGWPDLSFGWRYQIPHLLSLGLRVAAPDLLGYGRTDAPDPVAAYSLRSVAADIAALARHEGGGAGGADDVEARVFVGGHDWGGFLAWRVALWHPSLVRGVFSVCTPYAPPSPTWVDLPALAARLPHWRYQLQLAGPEAEAALVGRDRLRAFLGGMFGARGARGEAVFSTSVGVLVDNLDAVAAGGRPCPLLTPEELDFYADEYARSGGGMRGPLNWYRTRRANYEEELELVRGGRTRVAAPALMVVARRDAALPPAMAEGMGAHFDGGLVRGDVDAGHWALWEAPDQVNAYVGEFVVGVL